MKKMICMLAMLISLNHSVAWADETRAVEDKAKHAFGVSLGWITGTGLTYRRYLDESYVQASMFGYYNKDRNEKYGDVALSAGHYLYYSNLNDKFFPVALKVLGGAEIEIGKLTTDSQGIDQENDYFHVGGGIGIEIGEPNRPGFAISLDLTYIASFRDYNKSSRELVFIEPRPAASVFFNWK